MSGLRGRTILILCVLAAEGLACAQKPPSAPDHPWDSSLAKQQLTVPPRPASTAILDPAKVYTLSELVNIAEENNPDTRVAWQNAKARAAELGIAKSTLYPTLAAEVLAGTARENIFFGSFFERQTVETFAPVLALDYIIFDFGRRWRKSPSAGTTFWLPTSSSMTSIAGLSLEYCRLITTCSTPKGCRKRLRRT